MTPHGVTIAAPNHHRPDSFIGQNLTYRPYFTAALVGQKGRFYAIGTISGIRGYYFAAPMRDDGNTTVGVIAVKILRTGCSIRFLPQKAWDRGWGLGCQFHTTSGRISAAIYGWRTTLKVARC